MLLYVSVETVSIPLRPNELDTRNSLSGKQNIAEIRDQGNLLVWLTGQCVWVDQFILLRSNSSDNLVLQRQTDYGVKLKS